MQILHFGNFALLSSHTLLHTIISNQRHKSMSLLMSCVWHKMTCSQEVKTISLGDLIWENLRTHKKLTIPYTFLAVKRNNPHTLYTTSPKRFTGFSCYALDFIIQINVYVRNRDYSRHYVGENNIGPNRLYAYIIYNFSVI